MESSEERIAHLEQVVATLAEVVVDMRTRANFTHVIAGQAMFSLARLLGHLDKSGLILSGDAGLASITHALLLRHEQNELFSADDRAQAKQWREQLGRDA